MTIGNSQANSGLLSLTRNLHLNPIRPTAISMMDLEKMQTEQALNLDKMNQQEFRSGEQQRRGDFQTFLKSMGGVGDFLFKLASL
jgi:hypothetical protein